MTRPMSLPKSAIVFLLLFALLLGMASLTQAQPAPDPAAPTAGSFFTLQGTLDPGDTIQPSYPETNANGHPFNFSFAVSNSGPVALTIENAQGSVLWDGQAEAGETLWGYGTFTQGANEITLTNNGGSSADYELIFYDVPNTPYLWEGVAADSGLHSEASVNFPASGLYTFDLNAGSGSYQFLLDDDYIQKTVDTTGASVSYYVPAGTHTLQIVQDTGSGAAWSVDISGVGAAHDTLPYEKEGGTLGGQFAEAWLPLNLETATSANLALSVTGDTGDHLRLELYDPGDLLNPAKTLDPVYGGETVWATLALDAGTSLLHLVADGTNSGGLDYALSVSALDTPPAGWSGVANGAGLDSEIWIDFPDAGLYTFTLDATAGRFQVSLNDNYLLKTVEDGDSLSVTYYVPAGTHPLTVIPDDATGAEWSVDIGAVGAAADSLPYGKSGGELGGAGNPFTAAWLPVSLESATTVNMSIVLDGLAADTLAVEVYQGQSMTPTFTLASVHGDEKVWATFDLAAGINRLHLVAAGANADPLGYELVLEAVPVDSAAWSGQSLANGLNSEFMLDFSETGTYQFEIEATEGFANLLLESFAGSRQPAATLGTSYQMMVPAGEHVIHTVQDPAFAMTDWTAAVTPVTAGPSFFTFSGTLAAGESVTPEYTLSGGALDFNFEFAVSGSGPVDLTITDGDADNLLWSGSALAGEVLWGTETLTAGNNELTITNNSGSPAAVTLTLYEIPDVPYLWTGTAAGAGLNSTARVTFPSDGLYTFDLGAENNGRYQFALEDTILKTVESDTEVTYFVEAGTHALTIDQDTAGTTPWSVEITAAGATSDTLPYEKEGGLVGGAGNDFAEEWLPVYLAEETAVNLSTTLSGTLGNSALVTVYDLNGQALMSATVYTGETLWSTFDLPAGNNLLHLETDGANTAPLGYELALHPIPEPAYTWEGEAAAVGENSHIRLTMPEAGLYTFAFDAFDGRYQFQLDDEQILKTVEGTTTATYYVEAGTHDLWIDQDDSLGASWQVAITAAGPAADTLPYEKRGGNLGGAGNEFAEAWMPLYLGETVRANVQFTVSGNSDDALMLQVVNASGTPLLTLGEVYGGEVVWETVDLPDTGARIHLWTDGTNANSLAYELQVTPVPMPPYTWSGVSLDEGISSTIRLQIPVSGTYRFEVFMPQGFTTLLIDQADTRAAARAPQAFSYALDVPLAPGFHTFTSDQSDSFPVTSWVITATLLNAAPPQIDSVSPVEASDQTTTTLTILGANFQDGATAVLEQNGSSYPLQEIVYVGGGELQGVVPAGLPTGTYDVIVTNPDSQSATLVAALTVYHPAPQVTDVTPDTAGVVTTTITVAGEFFLDGAVVSLVDGGSSYPLATTFVSATELAATVPAGLAPGTYDVVVTNPDDQQGSLAAGLTVTPKPVLYLPLVVRG